MVWLRIALALIAAGTLALAARMTRLAAISDGTLNRRRVYFTGASYAASAIGIAVLAVWPTAVVGYVIGALILVELLIAPRLGPRRF